jgi:serine protease
MRIHYTLFALGIMASVLFPAQGSGLEKKEIQNPPARLIVKWRDQTHTDPVSTFDAIEGKIRTPSGLKLRVLRKLSGRAHLVTAATRKSLDRLEELAWQLSQQANVEFVEHDARRFPTLIPLDPEFANQIYLSDPINGINAPPAWDTTTGTIGTVVAVIDSGVLAEHVDLSGRILPGYDFISADPDGSFFTANDGDGRDPDPSDPGDGVASDACGLGTPESPSSWHGTRVASLIGANTDNQNGMVGVDWETKILPVRAVGRCGGFASDIADGIRWAAGLAVPGVPPNPTPADVINLSLGGSGQCLQTELNAIKDALAAGAMVVVAAGNQSKNALRTSPANCPGVTTVAATRFDGGLAGFSNYGIKVSLSAPGSDIVTASNLGLQEPVASPAGDNYSNTNGTSFSAPLVSGVAALMLSLNNGLNPDQITGTLRATTHGFPASTVVTCFDPLCGTGIVDATEAIQAVATGNISSASDGGNGVLAAMRDADSLANGALISGALDTDFEMDGYQVILATAGTLTVTSQGTTDTYGYLFDAAGNMLDQRDDIAFPTNLNFSMSASLAAGSYFIGVEGFSKNTRGEYQLQASYPSSVDTGGTETGGTESGGGGGTFDASLFILLLLPISGALMHRYVSNETSRPEPSRPQAPLAHRKDAPQRR